MLTRKPAAAPAPRRSPGCPLSRYAPRQAVISANMYASVKYWKIAFRLVMHRFADMKPADSRISARVSMPRVFVSRYTDSPRNTIDSIPAAQGMGSLPRTAMYPLRRNLPRPIRWERLYQYDSMRASCWGVKFI